MTAAGETLDVAAVCGLTFDERVVRRVLETDIDATVEALDAATASGLVREERARTVRLRPRPRASRRARRAVADPSRSSPLARRRSPRARRILTDVGEIAFHYAAGSDVGDAATVVRTALDAGDDALQRLAFDEAAHHFQTALARLDGADPMLTSLRDRVSLGTALNATAQLEAAQAVVAASGRPGAAQRAIPSGCSPPSSATAT